MATWRLNVWLKDEARPRRNHRARRIDSLSLFLVVKPMEESKGSTKVSLWEAESGPTGKDDVHAGHNKAIQHSEVHASKRGPTHMHPRHYFLPFHITLLVKSFTKSFMKELQLLNNYACVHTRVYVCACVWWGGFYYAFLILLSLHYRHLSWPVHHYQGCHWMNWVNFNLLFCRIIMSEQKYCWPRQPIKLTTRRCFIAL